VVVNLKLGWHSKTTAEEKVYETTKQFLSSGRQMLLGAFLGRSGSGGCGGLALTRLAIFFILVFDNELWSGILWCLCLVHILDLLLFPQQLFLERTHFAFDLEDGREDALKNP